MLLLTGHLQHEELYLLSITDESCGRSTITDTKYSMGKDACIFLRTRKTALIVQQPTQRHGTNSTTNPYIHTPPERLRVTLEPLLKCRTAFNCPRQIYYSILLLQPEL